MGFRSGPIDNLVNVLKDIIKFCQRLGVEQLLSANSLPTMF